MLRFCFFNSIQKHPQNIDSQGKEEVHSTVFSDTEACPPEVHKCHSQQILYENKDRELRLETQLPTYIFLNSKRSTIEKTRNIKYTKICLATLSVSLQQQSIHRKSCIRSSSEQIANHKGFILENYILLFLNEASTQSTQTQHT